MSNFNFKKIQPHLIALACFYILVLGYFSPVIVGDKKIQQSDITLGKGSAREVVDFREKTGEEALWLNNMFCGMPAYQVSTRFPMNLIQNFKYPLMGFISGPAGLIFLCLLSFYILMLTLRVDYRLAIVGAIGFAFASYLFVLIEAGHNTKIHAIAYMPLVLAGVILVMQKKYLLGGILTGIFGALEIYANHLQMTYYLFFVVLIYVIFELVEAIKTKKIAELGKSVAVLAAAGVLAILVNIGHLWTTYEYSKVSTRGKTELTIEDKNIVSDGLDKNYITDWSLGISETFTLLVPDFKGGASEYIGNDKKILQDVDNQFQQAVAQRLKYWGNQPFTSGPTYAGAIICFLFILGLFLVEGRIKWWLLTTTIFFIFLAWGKNFMTLTDIFVDYVPLYNKFRAVSMMLAISGVAIPILAILAASKVIQNPDIITEKKKQFFIALACTAGLLALFYISPGMFEYISDAESKQFSERILQYQQQNPQQAAQAKQYFDDLQENIETARIGIFKADVLRSLILILLAAGLLWFGSKKMSKTLLISILGLLIVGDMWLVNRRYLNKDNFVKERNLENPFVQRTASQFISKDQSDPYFRVFNQSQRMDRDAEMAYFHNNLGGYHAAKIKRYQQLFDWHLSSPNKTSAYPNPNVVNMLNAKYVITNPDSFPIVNTNALGNAWFVPDFKMVANPDSELVALGNFNPALTAIIDKKFENELKGFQKNNTGGTIELTDYKPNQLTYKSNTTAEQLAVFSDVYYEAGWQAYVNDKPVPHFRCNFILRAMRIPKGENTIVFKFEPTSYFLGSKLSLFASILLILGLGFVGFKSYKNQEEMVEEKPKEEEKSNNSEKETPTKRKIKKRKK